MTLTMSMLDIVSGVLLGGALLIVITLLVTGRTAPLFFLEPDSLSGTTVVITGGTSGLGLESAKRLAMGGADIHITARTDAKGKHAVQEILQYNDTIDKSKIHYQLLDMDSLDNVRKAKHWKIDKIDVLLNNAGVMAIPQRELTFDGFERQIQSNHLGHFLLTTTLAPKLTSTARIINISSHGYKMARKGLDLDYFWQGTPDYGSFKSYGQSKLANILFTRELQKRIDEGAPNLSWTTAAIHPGVVDTDLARNLIGDTMWDKIQSGTAPLHYRLLNKVLSVFMKTVAQGANTQIWLAAGEASDMHGGFYANRREVSLWSCAKDDTAAERLWQESEARAHVKFDVSQNSHGNHKSSEGAIQDE